MAGHVLLDPQLLAPPLQLHQGRGARHLGGSLQVLGLLLCSTPFLIHTWPLVNLAVESIAFLGSGG